MSYQILLLIATAFALSAFLTLVVRVGYPHHRRLALLIYAIGWIPFVLSIRQALVDHDEFMDQILHWKFHLAVGLGLLLLAWVASVLFPAKRIELRSSDLNAFPDNMDADLNHLALIDAKIATAVKNIQQSPMLNLEHLSSSQAKELRRSWAEFVESSYELDLLKAGYRSFYQINGFAHPRLHANAFLIAYGAFVSQYHAAAFILLAVDRNESVKKTLDEACPDAGIPRGSFSRIQAQVSHPENILRLNAGRAYLKLMKRRLDVENPLVQRVGEQLSEITKLAFWETDTFVGPPLELFEKHAAKVWFPLQRGVALGMASIRTTSRPYFITASHLADNQDQLQPGDILLTRREWHMTNLGIPGYWTHAALHLGSLEQLDQQFENLDLLKGQRPSEIIRSRFPGCYEKMACVEGAAESIATGEPMVMEALRPGVIIQSLNASATADSLGVLRPRVGPAERWNALMAALPHHGKPYNYQFDFRTDSALLCSQLVCKAYEETPGLTMAPTLTAGRLLFSPNEIAIKFDQEFERDNRQLDLVLFLDGVAEGRAVRRSDEDFRKSWSRPKWHIVLEGE